MQKYRYTQTHAQIYRQIQIQFLHFALFGSFGINAKDTYFIFGTPHTHTNADTQMHTQTQIQIPFYML